MISISLPRFSRVENEHVSEGGGVGWLRLSCGVDDGVDEHEYATLAIAVWEFCK
jgi:hypothetical protein